MNRKFHYYFYDNENVLQVGDHIELVKKSEKTIENTNCQIQIDGKTVMIAKEASGLDVFSYHVGDKTKMAGNPARSFTLSENAKKLKSVNAEVEVGVNNKLVIKIVTDFENGTVEIGEFEKYLDGKIDEQFRHEVNIKLDENVKFINK